MSKIQMKIHTDRINSIHIALSMNFSSAIPKGSMDRCQHSISDLVLSTVITTVRVFIMLAGTRCNSNLDPVTG
jgi:hypothetical protein